MSEQVRGQFPFFFDNEELKLLLCVKIIMGSPVTL